jgi:WD40 repeat protein
LRAVQEVEHLKK